MELTKVFIKNMVCRRCILAVEEILNKEQIPFHSVVFGEIDLYNELSEEEKQRLSKHLAEIGFELIDSQTSTIVEKIKILVIKRARNEDSEKSKVKLSTYIADTLHHEYTYLSSLFSSVEGRSIENYLIEQRIEKAKEYIIYDELSLSQIAFELDYSSAAHLSTQFKKITGLTPTNFKNIITVRKRRAIDSI